MVLRANRLLPSLRLLRVLCALCVDLTIRIRTRAPLVARLPIKSRRIRTYAKSTRIPFRIRTSKTQDLKPFRIRTYETPRGWGLIVNQTRRRVSLSSDERERGTSLRFFGA